MPKLHELLAVETNLENQANKTRTELVSTFEKKGHLFEEKVSTFIPSAEGQPEVVESRSDIQTTVLKELAAVSKYISKALDASFQVAEANTRAKADIVLENGAVLATDVTATALLELEKRVAELHALVCAIPTYDPAKGFEPDAARGIGYYIGRLISKERTKNVQKPLVLYPATEQHPAQVQLINELVPVGKIQEQEWTSRLSPAVKSDMIARADDLLRAVRSARSRANDCEVDTTKKIGATLAYYVFNQQSF